MLAWKQRSGVTQKISLAVLRQAPSHLCTPLRFGDGDQAVSCKNGPAGEASIVRGVLSRPFKVVS